MEIFLLGQFRIVLDSQEVELPSRPAQSLLAFLVLNSGVQHRREKLAGLFWPNASEENSRRSLRQALWHIRKAFHNTDFLEANDFMVMVHLNEDIWVDALCLDQKLHPQSGSEAHPSPEAAELVACVSVYRGELLPGFYEDWVVLERERLQNLFEMRMDLLLERLSFEKSWQDVLDWAEFWISRGSSCEPAFRAMMLAHHKLGNRSAVALTYERCKVVLERELDIQPADATAQLFQQLMADAQVGQPGGGPVASSGEPVRSIPSRLSLSASSRAPYKGLASFAEEDADLFFGREALVGRLVDRLVSLPGPTQLMTVVGSSGSGKSSLIRAGLIPTLRKRTGQSARRNGIPAELFPDDIYLLTPTAHPLEALAVNLTRGDHSVVSATTLLDELARDSRSLGLFWQKRKLNGDLQKDRAWDLLLIDHFEELFTQCHDEAERKNFINNVLSAASCGVVRVILVLRADFYWYCGTHPGLRQAIAANQEYIGQMSGAELSRAIEEPAHQAGLAFEPGLVDLILDDIGSENSSDGQEAGQGEPGALPLLSHALLETWKRRDGNILSLSGYAESGGVKGAIAQTAESTYVQLSGEDQLHVRRIFVRLTELGDCLNDQDMHLDARRRVSFDELVPNGLDPFEIRRILDVLAEARLVTIGEGWVEIAHEALIREWPALHTWLMEDREGLRIHRQITQAGQSWQALAEDPGELFRGARLTQALEWAGGHDGYLNAVEVSFLAASWALSEAEDAEKDAQWRHELENVRRLAAVETSRLNEQIRANRRLRWMASGLGLLFLIALLSVIFFLRQRDQAELQSKLATSYELAASAFSNLEIDPERSILLALAALKIQPTFQAREALHQALQASRVVQVIQSGRKQVAYSAFSPDGSLLAVQTHSPGISEVQIWDTSNWKQLRSLPGDLPSMQWTISDQLVIIRPEDEDPPGRQMAAVVNPLDGQILSRLPYPFQSAQRQSAQRDIRTNDWNVSPDGKMLSEAQDDGRTVVYDLSSGRVILELGKSGELPSYMVAFSPDNLRLAASVNNQPAVYDIGTGQKLVDFPSDPSGAGPGVFSPDGKLFAVCFGSRVVVADAKTGQVLLRMAGHQSYYFQLAYSLDQSMLAGATSDGFAFVWDAVTGQELYKLAGHTGAVNGVTFSPDGKRLLSSSSDGTLRIWDITPSGNREELAWNSQRGQSAQPNPFTAVAYSPDGLRLAAAGGQGAASVWDAKTGKEYYSLPGESGRVGAVAFSGDGRLLATSSAEKSVSIWDALSGKLIQRLEGHQDWVGGLSFSPDGQKLVTIGYDRQVILWDVRSGEMLLSREAYPELDIDSSQLIGASYSPNGKYFATAGGWRVKIWEAASGDEFLALPRQDAPVYTVAFSPDGKELAYGISLGLGARIVDSASGKEIASLIGHRGSVVALRFSQDGEIVYSAGVEGTVRAWDAHSGVPFLILSRQKSQVSGIDLSPDGQSLAASNIDGVITVINLQLGDLVRLARQRLTRDFTAEECQVFLHQNSCELQSSNGRPPPFAWRPYSERADGDDLRGAS